MAGTCHEYSFIFASCEPLIMLINVYLPIAMRVKVKEKNSRKFVSFLTK